MEDNNDTGAVFLDLAKSFNSISHEIFLKKAKNFNLSIYIFTSQIFSRKLNCIKFGIDLADKITIYQAVPQGTVRNSYFSYLPTTCLKNGNVKMMLFNLRMTLVLYANLKVMKLFHKKQEILEQTDKYLTENQCRDVVLYKSY